MATAIHSTVFVYTTPTRPDCWALKAWLKREGVAFKERNLILSTNTKNQTSKPSMSRVSTESWVPKQ